MSVCALAKIPVAKLTDKNGHSGTCRLAFVKTNAALHTRNNAACYRAARYTKQTCHCAAHKCDAQGHSLHKHVKLTSCT